MKNTLKNIFIQIVTWQAKIVIAKYKPKILAITGSVGKTSTKDVIFSVFSKQVHVRKSDKRFSNDIVIPLTILGAGNEWNNKVSWLRAILFGFRTILLKKKYPSWLILEIGIRKPKDIKKIAKWLPVDALIVTRIGETPPHIEFFPSKDHLIKEKTSMFSTLRKLGTIFLNHDDENFETLLEKATDLHNKNKIVTFGFHKDSNFRASNLEIKYDDKGFPSGSSYRVNFDGKSVPVVLNNCLGENHLYASLSAIAFCENENMNIVNIVADLLEAEAPPGRMKILDGVKNTKIIDDTYNSSPVALSSALSILGDIKCSGKKIVILGDMLELGKYTEESHKTIGKQIAGLDFSHVILVGKRAKSIEEGAHEAGLRSTAIHIAHDSRDAGKMGESLMSEGDIVLVKGSQAMQMEHAVEEIMMHPEDKARLLVR